MRPVSSRLIKASRCAGVRPAKARVSERASATWSLVTAGTVSAVSSAMSANGGDASSNMRQTKRAEKRAVKAEIKFALRPSGCARYFTARHPRATPMPIYARERRAITLSPITPPPRIPFRRMPIRRRICRVEDRLFRRRASHSTPAAAIAPPEEWRSFRSLHRHAGLDVRRRIAVGGQRAQDIFDMGGVARLDGDVELGALGRHIEQQPAVLDFQDVGAKRT